MKYDEQHLSSIGIDGLGSDHIRQNIIDIFVEQIRNLVSIWFSVQHFSVDFEVIRCFFLNERAIVFLS